MESPNPLSPEGEPQRPLELLDVVRSEPIARVVNRALRIIANQRAETKVGLAARDRFPEIFLAHRRSYDHIATSG